LGVKDITTCENCGENRSMVQLALVRTASDNVQFEGRACGAAV